MRRLLRLVSPWHRGYARGYDKALQHVENGLRVSIGVATAYGQTTLDEATRALARAMAGGRS